MVIRDNGGCGLLVRVTVGSFPRPSEGFPRNGLSRPLGAVGTGGGMVSRILGVPRVTQRAQGPGPGPWACAQGPGPMGQRAQAHGPMWLLVGT